MKRTIKEVYDLIVEKRDNAKEAIFSTEAIFLVKDVFRTGKLKGSIMAYQDVLSLIESSHLLEEDKPIKGSGLEALENLIESGNIRLCVIGGEEIDNQVETIRRELKALEIIKGLLDFDFAIRYGNNQPMIKITNKRNEQYWELPESNEKWNSLKEVFQL